MKPSKVVTICDREFEITDTSLALRGIPFERPPHVRQWYDAWFELGADGLRELAEAMLAPIPGSDSLGETTHG